MFDKEVTQSALDNMGMYCVNQFGDDAPGNSIHRKGSYGVQGDDMSSVAQEHCGWAEWGMVGEHICTVRGGATSGEGGTLHCTVTYLTRMIPGRMIL
jgi:hypothetical protein